MDVAASDRKSSSVDRYVIPDLEATLTDEKKSPDTQPNTPIRKTKICKRRSKSMQFSSQAPPNQVNNIIHEFLNISA